MANLFNFTKENAFEIISLSKQGTDQRVIAKKIGCSQATISKFVRAYNGNQKEYELLSVNSKSLIKELQKTNNDYKTYQCSLFFGLIKLKFIPIKN